MQDAYDNGIGRPKFPDPVTFSSGQADCIRLGEKLSSDIDRMSDKDVPPWGNEKSLKPSFRIKVRLLLCNQSTIEVTVLSQCAYSSAPLK